ncbi:hypothetical protein IOLA_228 [uncultured bacterium]|nr:hypothetical protein IOLA_228 [uncultured bacterium]
MTSLYYLSNFDIFSPEEYIIEYTKIYLGKDILKQIISDISNCNYQGYLNNKTIQIVFTFENIDDAQYFFDVLNTYDLCECFNKNRFYSSIQDTMLITDNLNLKINSKILNTKNIKFFSPKIRKNKIYLYIPNNKLAYIHLYNIESEKKNNIFNIGEIKEYATIYLSQQIASSRFFIKSSIIEKSIFEGYRIGCYSIIDNNLYFVCDIGLCLLNLVENCFIKILDINNIKQINNYCNLHHFEFNEFQNQILNN